MAFESCLLCHSTVFKPRVSVTNSVYEHLRSTNTLPENIISDIPALLSSVQKDLDDYESEIHRFQIRIADIQNRREMLRIHAENLQSLQSPIRRLPNELLTRVFGYLCIENDLTEGCPSAVTLGSVCLRWRQLTIECPELWSNMVIYLYEEDDFDEVVHGRLTCLVNLYLDRSKSHLLGLTFIGGPWCPDGDDGSDNPILQVAQQSFRWKHVSFDADKFSPGNYPIWDSLDLPVLDTLYLTSSYDVHDCSLEMLKNTPILRAFHASGMYCLWHRDLGFPLPSARATLHELTYDLNVGNFYDVLSNFTDLRRLFVVNRITRKENTTIVVNPPRLLSDLHTLSLTFKTLNEENAKDNFLTSVLSSLTVPRLTNLAVKQLYDQEQAAPFYAIQSFLTRSSCSLQVLTLKNIAVADSELVAILKQCVALEALHVVDPSPNSNPVITKAFIESLHSLKRSSIQTSPPPIAKSLRSLSLTVKSPKFDAVVFIGMISSRWIPNPDMAKTIGISCLRSVELFLPEKITIEKDAYQPLLPFEKAGMMIVVKQENAKGYVF